MSYIPINLSHILLILLTFPLLTVNSALSIFPNPHKTTESPHHSHSPTDFPPYQSNIPPHPKSTTPHPHCFITENFHDHFQSELAYFAAASVAVVDVKMSSMYLMVAELSSDQAWTEITCPGVDANFHEIALWLYHHLHSAHQTSFYSWTMTTSFPPPFSSYFSNRQFPWQN